MREIIHQSEFIKIWNKICEVNKYEKAQFVHTLDINTCYNNNRLCDQFLSILYTILTFYKNNGKINARSEKTRNAVKEEFEHICVTESKKELLENTDAVIVVVEPQNSMEVLKELGSYDIKEKIIISFMSL